MISSASAKYAPVVIPALGAALAIEANFLIKVVAVIGGLLFGGMWRAGSLASEGKGWVDIRRDLFISLLIGGANAVLTLALVKLLDVGVLFSMALAVIVGATGLRALPELKGALTSYLRRRLIGDDIALIQPRAPDIEDAVRRLRDLDGPTE